MKLYIKIDGIFCNHCRSVIRGHLLEYQEIRQVKIRGDVAEADCTRQPDLNQLIAGINKLGYHTSREQISTSKIHSHIRIGEFAAIAVSLALLFWLMYRIFGYNVFNMIPAIDSSISYGMLVVTGLFTSIHCISMCGAINLTAVYGTSRIASPVLYNAGRILSYTLIGFAAGALGSVFQVSQTLSGVIILAAAILMLVMALSMLGIVRLPESACHKYESHGKNAFIIGLLNGFMPCGPLQAMQLYALSTGSIWGGGLSMFLFGLGTVPLMTAMGVCISLLRGKWRIRINKVASVLLLFLAVTMVNRGLVGLGVNPADIFENKEEYTGYIRASLEDDYQVVETDLDYGSFGDILVAKNVPVKFIIHADQDKITGCNNEIVLSAFGVSQQLSAGDNVIWFTPTESGTYTAACWMNMITNSIVVVDNTSEL